MIDTIFHWRIEQKIRYITKPPQCRLRVFELKEATIVIATQLAKSTGSISQEVESLATLVHKCFKIYPGYLVWIEHFGPQSYTSSLTEEDRYSLVILRWDERHQTYKRNVQWFGIPSFVLSPLLIPGNIDEDQIPTHELQPLWNEVNRAREEALSNADTWRWLLRLKKKLFSSHSH